MAKKNKKFTKINQKIKKFFDNDPFDVGIERVSSQTLSELMHYLGIYDIDFEKPKMIKRLRHLWSNADTIVREQILEFFTQNKTIYKSDKVEENSAQKKEKILSFLSELDPSKEEEEAILEHFKEVKSKKITFSKVKNALLYLRLEKKRTLIEKRCHGSFDLENRFEFFGVLYYHLFDTKIKKTQQLLTKAFDIEYIQEAPLEEVIALVEDQKAKTIQKQQHHIDEFTNSLSKDHPYLSPQQMIEAIQASPTHIKTAYPFLPLGLLQDILSKELDITTVKIQKEEVLLEKKESLSLPVIHKKIDYTLEFIYPLESLLEQIWLATPLHDLRSSIASNKASIETHFLEDFQQIIQESKRYATQLQLKEEEFYNQIYVALIPYLPKNLILTPKLIRKTTKRFLYTIQELLQKQQRQQLLAQTIRDFKNLFPLARSLRRKITLHIGPTNSGKTYAAMQRLKEADTGYYLAPLRLLALEGYEDLLKEKINASLITGEEQILDEEATHISSTIEMLNYDVDVDVCVIDEVQLIDDRDRGWAWANAIIGAPAKEIILTASPAAKDAIIELAHYLGEELEIIEFERKNPLQLLENPISLEKIEKQTAVIAFSRKEVLRLKQKLAPKFKVSTVYGNLSPEVRREEARRFREGESEVLVATDAIAMGLNLPIKTILFSKAKKYDGIIDRELTPNEIKQIAGRAGRYGYEDVGYVAGVSKEIVTILQKNWNKEDIPVSMPFKVMANLEHIKLVSSILEENSLAKVLEFFAQNMTFSGPFVAANLEDMVEIARIIDKYELDITTKFHLATAPLSLSSEYIISVFESYLQKLQENEPIHYEIQPLQHDYARTNEELLHAEDMVKEISLYLWLSFRFEQFVDAQKARQYRDVLNAFIEKSLQQTHFASKCKLCNTILPKGYKFRICQKCYKKHYKKRRYR